MSELEARPDNNGSEHDIASVEGGMKLFKGKVFIPPYQLTETKASPFRRKPFSNSQESRHCVYNKLKDHNLRLLESLQNLGIFSFLGS
jgi:hypothetical protein